MLANIFAYQEITAADPYVSIRYGNAFDQQAANTKHRSVVKRLRCDENVLYDDQDQQVTPDNPLTTAELEQYEKDCLQPLAKARFKALAEPGIVASTQLAVDITAGLVGIYILGSDIGKGLSGFVLIQDCAQQMPKIAQTGYNLISRPDNPLSRLEDRFAKNKTYIPNALWPRIIQAFTEARTNGFTREKQMEFLDFALDITSYRPKPTIEFKNDMTLQDVKAEIRHRINQFFSNYQACDATVSDIDRNVSKFIDTLADNATQAPRYLYLCGMGGIGKTHFVQELSKWINELMPNSIQFEDFTLQSKDELEGNAQKPGIILNVLRKQLRNNKHGSIIMIDEATWLNDPTMIDASKRTFNGNCTKISSKYFGTDGNEISFKAPPMLIVLANNETIKDDALATRFDTVNYPTPTKKTLLSYAFSKAHQSTRLKELACPVDERAITSWVQNLQGKENNFRHIQGGVERLLEEKQKQTIIID